MNTVSPTSATGKGMAEVNGDTGDSGIVLGLLNSVERDHAVTQRKLARDLGIALGLVNAYLRRCVRKGLIKVSQVPLNRYAYYLTPQGFAEKSRLTAEYLTFSLNFFRQARADCALALSQCAALGWRKVALCGAGELAEIAVLSAGESDIEIVCVIDPDKVGSRCAGLPVVSDLIAARNAAAQLLDGVILTDTEAPQARFEALLAEVKGLDLPRGFVAAPALLAISRTAIAEPAGS
jgi:DNA-binding MarR family transcriptional regulator